MQRLFIHTVLLLSSIFLFNSCFRDNEPDFSYEWIDYQELQGNVTGSAVAALGNRIIVGTEDGIQYFTVGSNAQWTQSNLRGIQITALFVHPFIQNLVIATTDPNASGNTNTNPFPIYRSTDSGATWTGIQTGLKLEGSSVVPTIQSITWKLIEEAQIGRRYADMYVSVSGSGVARSRDDGVTWQLIKGSISAENSTKCHVNVMQSFYTDLYLGCELPGNQTFVEIIDLNQDNYQTLPTSNRFITTSQLGQKAVVGLKPSYFTPGLSYGLLKGGLIAIVKNEFKWVFDYSTAGGQTLNTTLTTFWINPSDLNDLVFGGYENTDNNTFSLYSTPDHGKTFKLIEPPSFMNLSSPKIMGSFETGLSAQNLMLLVSGKNAQGQTKTRVMSRNQVSSN
jgi:hypothetical protein